MSDTAIIILSSVGVGFLCASILINLYSYQYRERVKKARRDALAEMVARKVAEREAS